MNTEYGVHFITTFRGKKFHYLDPDPEDIDIRDIAHALSMTCRFGGHVREFYSVAEHSMRVAILVPPRLMIPALLHDAHEAYLHDVPRPIKYDMPGYKEMADRIQRAIDIKFNIDKLSVEDEAIIKNADNVMLMTEAKSLGINTDGWVEIEKPLAGEFVPVKHGVAEVGFMLMWKKLTEGGQDGGAKVPASV
jgi:hypothetical protein